MCTAFLNPSIKVDSQHRVCRNWPFETRVSVPTWGRGVRQVDVTVALSVTAAVQGRYRCLLDAAIAGPAAVKQLRHEYDGAPQS